jgi:hypothetical protein
LASLALLPLAAQLHAFQAVIREFDLKIILQKSRSTVTSSKTLTHHNHRTGNLTGSAAITDQIPDFSKW